jgi:hypothetical protein
MESKVQHALALAARGFKVFPIAINAKSPPLLQGWPQKATSDPALIESWWIGVPNANVGIHCDGLLVIDVDVKKGGKNALDLLRLTDDLPATLCTSTPSGGEHHFYRLPDGHNGVPNSVSTLGRGLDIRSAGGYVVAPGSVVPAGTYSFQDAAAQIAAAPDWLVQHLGTVRSERDAEDNADRRVPDAAVEVCERALDWLKSQAPAIEGQGGDRRTFAVVCGLRDMGVSPMQAFALLQDDWNDRCSPPWDLDDLWSKVRNAYRYAENDAGSRAAQPSEFPAVAPSSPPIRKSEGKGALILSQFANQESRGAGYVVKGALQRASYAEVYGAPGEGKTFVGLDIGYHVAADKPWMGLKVRGGPVLYLAYEGTGGMVKRAQALRQKYGKNEVPLYIVGASFNLREKGGRQELGAIIGSLPAKPALIIIDTFARALMGGDENSAQDVGAFNSAIAALIESTGACVMIVHHSGKDKSKGARGSSALLGALDTEIEVDGGQVIARKQRDVEIAPPIGFKLVPLVVGLDEDGDETTSCVVEPAAVGATALERINGNAKRGFDVLCNMALDNRPIDPLEWREKCSEFLGGKSLAQRFYDIKKTLLAKGYIVVLDSGFVQRKMT